MAQIRRMVAREQMMANGEGNGAVFRVGWVDVPNKGSRYTSVELTLKKRTMAGRTLAGGEVR